MKIKNVGVLLFDGVEVLDFTAPYEVFTSASRINNLNLNVFSISVDDWMVETNNGINIKSDFLISEPLEIDFLIVPGGDGTRKIVQNEKILSLINLLILNAKIIASVCSGSLILRKIGVLDNGDYCTHHSLYEEMSRIVTNGNPRRNHRFSSNKNIYTSAGITAGIDLSLHLVKKMFGEKRMHKTKRYIEYL